MYLGLADRGNIHIIAEQQRPRLKKDRKKGTIHKQNRSVMRPSPGLVSESEIPIRGWGRTLPIKRKTENVLGFVDSCQGKAMEIFQENTAERTGAE